MAFVSFSFFSVVVDNYFVFLLCFSLRVAISLEVVGVR